MVQEKKEMGPERGCDLTYGSQFVHPGAEMPPASQPFRVCAYLLLAPSRYTLSPSLSDMNGLPCSLAFYWVWQVRGRWDPLTSSLNSHLLLSMGLLYPALSIHVPVTSLPPHGSTARKSFTDAHSKHSQLPVPTFGNGVSIPTLNYPTLITFPLGP